MAHSRSRLGRAGEDLAARTLAQLGYVIIQRNYRCNVGELDIVARDAECLVFVEVRTRHGDQFGTPEQSVNARKQRKLIECAQTYLQEHDIEDADWRVDVVAVELDAHGAVARLEVVRNAVEATD